MDCYYFLSFAGPCFTCSRLTSLRSMANYLVYTSCPAHVVDERIVGIADDFSEVVELLWNYTLYQKSISKDDFENHVMYADIIVLRISNTDYRFLKSVQEGLDDPVESSEGDFKPENFNTRFWMVPFELDDEENGEEKIPFTKKEVASIKRIIKRSHRVT